MGHLWVDDLSEEHPCRYCHFQVGPKCVCGCMAAESLTCTPEKGALAKSILTSSYLFTSLQRHADML